MNYNVKNYRKNYSDNGLFSMLKKCWRKAGLPLVYKALQLYFVLQKPEVPVYAKTVIVCSLGYLISPVDAVPDFLPGGFADDLMVVSGALLTVSLFIDDDVRRKAKLLIDNLFGSGSSRYLDAA